MDYQRSVTTTKHAAVPKRNFNINSGGAGRSTPPEYAAS